MGITYKINIGYELELFSDHLGKPKFSPDKEFGYIYLYSPQVEPFYSDFNFKNEYLDFLHELGFSKKEVIRSKNNLKNWFGKLENIERERKLNSKLTNYKFLIERGYCKESRIFNFDLSQELYNEKKLILKIPYEVAGRGNFILDKFVNIGILEKIKKSYPKVRKVIIEPYYEKLLDLGTINYNGELFYHINLNSKKGSFKGCISCDNFLSLTELFPEINSVKLNSIIREIIKAQKEYSKYHGIENDNWGMDSIIYKNNDELEFIPILELNYRRTMGHSFHDIKRVLCKKDEHCAWLFLDKQFNEHGYLKLSPEEVNHQSVFLKNNDLVALMDNSCRLLSISR